MTTTSKKIGTAMAWTMISRAGRMVLGILTSALVVRGLGDYDYGVLSLLRSILMFVVMLAGVGTGQAVLKFLPELRVARSAATARRLVRGVFAAHLIAWLVLLGIAILARDAMPRIFHADGIGTFVLIAIVLAIFEILFTVATHVLNASFDAARLALAALVSHVIYAVGIVLTFERGWGIVGVLAAAAAGNAVATIVVWARVRAATDFATAESETPMNAVTRARVLRYSLPFAAIGILNLIVWRQSEVLLLGHFRSAEEAGYFDVAYRLPQMMLEFVPGTLWPLVMAGMAEAFARDRASLGRAVAKYYRLLFALCAPLCVGGAIAGGRCVEVLYGDAMQPAVIPTQIFFVVFTISFLSTPLSMALYVLERTHVNLLIYAFLAIINIGLDLVLIPRFGVYGAIVPVAIAILMQPILYYRVVRRLDAGISIPFGTIARCVGASLAALIMVPILWVWDGALGLGAAVLVGGVAILLGYRVARVVNAEDAGTLASLPVPGVSRVVALLCPHESSPPKA